MIAVISDIHSNLEALNKVLATIESRDIIIGAGDIVGCGAKPNECIDAFIKRNIRSVIGNYDLACIGGDGSEMNPIGSEAIDWTIMNLSNASTRFLKKLPEKLEIEQAGKRIVVMHGSPMDHINDYVFPWVSERVLDRYLDMTDADILILGHTHVPFVKKLGRKLIINPGSVGQPRDHRMEASHAIIDPVRMKASIIRTEYDIIKVSNEITEAGLPVFLAERLFQGM